MNVAEQAAVPRRKGAGCADPGTWVKAYIIGASKTGPWDSTSGAGTNVGGDQQAMEFCRHCAKQTHSATDLIDVGGVRYEVVYCSECGIASSGFRLSRDGKREGPADNLMLRRLHKPAKK